MPDVLGQQRQKRADSRVFMLGIRPADDNVPIIVQLECNLATRIDP